MSRNKHPQHRLRELTSGLQAQLSDQEGFVLILLTPEKQSLQMSTNSKEPSAILKILKAAVAAYENPEAEYCDTTDPKTVN